MGGWSSRGLTQPGFSYSMYKRKPSAAIGLMIHHPGFLMQCHFCSSPFLFVSLIPSLPPLFVFIQIGFFYACFFWSPNSASDLSFFLSALWSSSEAACSKSVKSEETASLEQASSWKILFYVRKISFSNRQTCFISLNNRIWVSIRQLIKLIRAKAHLRGTDADGAKLETMLEWTERSSSRGTSVVVNRYYTSIKVQSLLYFMRVQSRVETRSLKNQRNLSVKDKKRGDLKFGSCDYQPCLKSTFSGFLSRQWSVDLDF